MNLYEYSDIYKELNPDVEYIDWCNHYVQCSDMGYHCETKSETKTKP